MVPSDEVAKTVKCGLKNREHPNSDWPSTKLGLFWISPLRDCFSSCSHRLNTNRCLWILIKNLWALTTRKDFCLLQAWTSYATHKIIYARLHVLSILVLHETAIGLYLVPFMSRSAFFWKRFVFVFDILFIYFEPKACPRMNLFTRWYPRRWARDNCKMWILLRRSLALAGRRSRPASKGLRPKTIQHHYQPLWQRFLSSRAHDNANSRRRWTTLMDSFVGRRFNATSTETAAPKRSGYRRTAASVAIAGTSGFYIYYATRWVYYR